jgi:hypothetical protein
VYTIAMQGPGLVNVNQLGHGVVGLKLYGTTPATTVDIELKIQRLHRPATPLQIGSIKVVSGQLGGITAGGAALLGPMTPIGNSIKTLQFGQLGSNANINVNGSVTDLDVGAVTLGPNGQVRITGDVSHTLDVSGPMVIDGGQFIVGNDLSGTMSAGSMSLSHGGRFAVGRDVPGTVTVTGDLAVASGGAVSVLRNLNSLTINGDLRVAPGTGDAAVSVGGNLTALTVNGVLAGQGSKTARDLVVGLDLSRLTVLGGTPGLGGIQNANIDVGKSLLALNVSHGIFNSLITAGVLINGGTGGSSVGPDGLDAVLNSQLLAGQSILNLTIGGDVRSTFATNPDSTGYPTRIVAGEDRQGNFLSGGLIDNFQITGQLIDSVIAASVAPGGGSGILPPAGYGLTFVGTPLNIGNYDAPAGTITGGSVAAPVKFPNFSMVSYVNEVRVNPPGTVGDYNRTLSPTLSNTILPGAINPSFASASLPATATGTQQTTSTSTSSGGSSGTQVTTSIPSLANANSVLPLPTKPTVLGGVVSTAHTSQAADFAGIFASDARGVIVGTLPQ